MPNSKDGVTVTETLVAQLCHTSTTSIALLLVNDREKVHFLIRKMKWKAPDNIAGTEVKLLPDTAKVLAQAIFDALGVQRFPETAKQVAG